MPEQGDDTRPEPLQVVAVLRLLVTRRGRLLYGEAIEAETEVGRRFKGWAGLDAAVKGVIAGVVDSAQTGK